MSERQAFRELLKQADPTRPVVVLTGAGISAESGIPTFRGEEGYWTVGSDVFHPQEMATQAAFKRMPREVWRWYLYRRSVCRAAGPNAAHRMVAELEQALGPRFHLITQNVDGLHQQAGNSAARTYEVHGNIDFRRLADDSDLTLHPMPEGIGPKGKDDEITDAEWRLLHIDGQLTRPHVLWFDEYYQEQLYRSQTAMKAAERCGVMISIGTTASTNLPVHAVAAAGQAGAVTVDINIAPNDFRTFSERRPLGLGLSGKASEWLPMLVEELRGFHS